MWEFRQIYEQPAADLMEAEAFFSAFARFHDIDGRRIECILTKAGDKTVKVYSSEALDGITVNSSVLFLRDEAKGLTPGASIRIDGNHCKVIRVSRPVLGLTRIELEGYSG